MAEKLSDEDIGRAMLGAKSISITLSRDGIFFQTDGLNGQITTEQAEKAFPVIAALSRTAVKNG